MLTTSKVKTNTKMHKMIQRWNRKDGKTSCITQIYGQLKKKKR